MLIPSLITLPIKSKAPNTFRQIGLNHASNIQKNNGFLALGVTREDFVKELLTVKRRANYRMRIAEDIYLFYWIYQAGEGPTHGLNPLQKKFRQKYNKINKLYQQLIEKTSKGLLTVVYPHKLDLFINVNDYLDEVEYLYQDLLERRRIISNIKKFIDWLGTQTKAKNYEELFKELNGIYQNLNDLDQNILRYCSEEDQFEYYLANLSRHEMTCNLSLGIESALVYAELTSLDLFFWQVDENRQGYLISQRYQESRNNQRIDLLMTDSFDGYCQLDISLALFQNQDPNKILNRVKNICSSSYAYDSDGEPSVAEFEPQPQLEEKNPRISRTFALYNQIDQQKITLNANNFLLRKNEMDCDSGFSALRTTRNGFVTKLLSAPITLRHKIVLTMINAFQNDRLGFNVNRFHVVKAPANFSKLSDDYFYKNTPESFNKIVQFCLKNYDYFLNTMLESNVWLDCNMALLYGELTNQSIYIWSIDNEDNNQYKTIHYYVAKNDLTRIDILHVDGKAHFHSLSHNIANQQQINIESSIQLLSDEPSNTLSIEIASEQITVLKKTIHSTLTSSSASSSSEVNDKNPQDPSEIINKLKANIKKHRPQFSATDLLNMNQLISLIARVSDHQLLVPSLLLQLEKLNEQFDTFTRNKTLQIKAMIVTILNQLQEVYFKNITAAECFSDLLAIVTEIEQAKSPVESHLFEYLQSLTLFLYQKELEVACDVAKKLLLIVPLFSPDQVTKYANHFFMTIMKRKNPAEQAAMIDNYLALLINCAATDNNGFIILSLLMETSWFCTMSQQNAQLDNHIINLLNNNHISRQDPFEKYLFLARFIKENIASNENRLRNLIKKIKFSTSHVLQRALFQVFISQCKDIEVKKLFLETLVITCKLPFFKDPAVVAGFEDAVVDSVDIILNDQYRLKYASSLRGTEKNCFNGVFPVESLLTLSFLRLSKYNPGFVHKQTSYVWRQILFYIGLNTSINDQVEACQQPLSSDEKQTNLILKSLGESLISLHRYFNNVEKHQDKYLKIHNLILNRIVRFARLTKNKNIDSIVKRISTIVNDCLAVNKDQLNVIFSYEDNLGKFENGLAAVAEVFYDVMSSRNTDKWSTHGMHERINFIYCYAKYPLSDFNGWLQQLNQFDPSVQRYLRDTMPADYDESKELQENMLGVEHLSKLGFKILQNNQVTATKIATNPPNASRYVFEKVGTGQGKSLIIALSALHYAKQLPNTRVYVFTVYDHLAKRDFNRFKTLFEMSNVKCAVLEDASTKIPDDVQIVYAELSTYYDCMHAQINANIKHDRTKKSNFDYYKPGIVILDEFDSIILDSDQFGNTVHNYGELFNLGSVKKQDIDSLDNYVRTLSSRSGLGSFFAALKKHELFQLTSNWYSKVETSLNDAAHTGYDVRGIKHNYVGGDLWEMTRGKLYCHPCYFDHLSFLKNSQQLIGVSGSIDSTTVRRFDRVFPNLTYIDIPCFFGLHNNKNREIFNNLAQPLQPDEWLKRIEADIVRAIKAKQPILVFADINNTAEWELIEKLIVRLSLEYHRTKYIIRDQDDLTDEQISNSATQSAITLSSIVSGRGTDYVMKPEVFNECEGLHVCVTFPPSNKNKLDPRLKTQLIGRTARMENPGTHSIIVNKLLGRENQAPIELGDATERYHLLASALLKMIKTLTHDEMIWKKWLLFVNYINKSETFPSVLAAIPTAEQQAQFILNNIFEVNLSHTHTRAPRNGLFRPQLGQDNSEYDEKQSAFTP